MEKNEIIRHQFNGHELQQTLGDGEGQGGSACCSSWSLRVRHDGGLNNNNVSELIKVKGLTSSQWCTAEPGITFTTVKQYAEKTLRVRKALKH